MADSKTSIRTFTGRRFDILEPRALDVNIKDIAHALSLLCRFTGHVNQFYSVAQHSLIVSSKMPREFRLWGLLHDASEAYVADLSRPLKHAPEMSRYRTAEKNVLREICRRFSLKLPEPPEVKEVDRRMCATEMRDLMGGIYGEGILPYPEQIIPVSSAIAEAMFLERYYELRYESIFDRPRFDQLTSLNAR